MLGSDRLGELIGIEAYEAGEDWVRARVPVSEQIMQPYGIVHGGVYPVLAESICSRATAEAVLPEGMRAFGQANDASFLRPIGAGHLNAEGRARHRGRSWWVWEVDVRDDDARLCAIVRMTVAVRPSVVERF